jgi:hypothetical protein
MKFVLAKRRTAQTLWQDGHRKRNHSQQRADLAGRVRFNQQETTKSCEFTAHTLSGRLNLPPNL